MSTEVSLGMGHRAMMPVEQVRHLSSGPQRAMQLAQHFESMLILETVKAARADGGWLGEDASESSEATAGMGEEFLAQAMAAKGGFGLAPLLASAMERSASTEQSIEKTEQMDGAEVPGRSRKNSSDFPLMTLDELPIK